MYLDISYLVCPPRGGGNPFVYGGAIDAAQAGIELSRKGLRERSRAISPRNHGCHWILSVHKLMAANSRLGFQRSVFNILAMDSGITQICSASCEPELFEGMGALTNFSPFKRAGPVWKRVF